jgi:hypothetical protein
LIRRNTPMAMYPIRLLKKLLISRINSVSISL